MDPIADMFIRIVNGYRAKKEVVIFSHSRLKGELADILQSKGFIAGVEKRGKKIRKFLEVRLSYPNSVPVLSGCRRVSKSSRRLYTSAKAIRPVRGGLGPLILSTSRGLMTGAEAKKAGIGGEPMVEVW